jgi:hypothetical protein
MRRIRKNAIKVCTFARTAPFLTARYGDYVSIRRYSPNGKMFDAAGYTTQNNPPPAGAQFQDVHYILFGRPGSDKDDGGNPDIK